MNRSARKFYLLLLFFSVSVYGQMEKYEFAQDIEGVDEQWAEIEIPLEVFGVAKSDLSDLRIFGITASKDTIEAPYLLRSAEEKQSIADINFKTLNSSERNGFYYFTYEMLSLETINQIRLDFQERNYDRRIMLEGSNDQKEWFKIVENYRLLSIKNSTTDFVFNEINFPEAKYQFFRVAILSKKKPLVRKAMITQRVSNEGAYHTHEIKRFETREEKKNTIIEVDLGRRVPLDRLKVLVGDKFDYYRPVSFRYANDSVQIDGAWVKRYKNLHSGTLHSFNDCEFVFAKNILLQHLEITVRNQDNEPLNINGVEVQGAVQSIVARFTTPAKYFLVYGNAIARSPQYDLARFADKIPENPMALSLGKRFAIDRTDSFVRGPLFQNKMWLWAIMLVMVALLGWFSLTMIRNK